MHTICFVKICVNNFNMFFSDLTFEKNFLWGEVQHTNTLYISMVPLF